MKQYLTIFIILGIMPSIARPSMQASSPNSDKKQGLSCSIDRLRRMSLASPQAALTPRSQTPRPLNPSSLEQPLVEVVGISDIHDECEDSGNSMHIAQASANTTTSVHEATLSPQWKLAQSIMRTKNRRRSTGSALSTSHNELPTSSPKAILQGSMVDTQNTEEVANSIVLPAASTEESQSSAQVVLHTATTPSHHSLLLNIAVSTTSSAITAATMVLLMQHKRDVLSSPPKRFITGLEFPLAISAASSISSASVKVIGGIVVFFALRSTISSIHNWIHSTCYSKQELLEQRFAATLNQQIQQLAEQTKSDIATHRQETYDTTEEIIEALEQIDKALQELAQNPSTNNVSQVAANLHNATEHAREAHNKTAVYRSDIAVPMIVPKQEKACGCCTVQ